MRRAHDVILMDYPGIGRSSGQTPSTIAALATDCVAFCRAIDLTLFDVVGFSLGGMITQQLGAEHPDMIRRIILLGPRREAAKDHSSTTSRSTNWMMSRLCSWGRSSRQATQATAGRAYVERLKSRVDDLDVPVSKRSAAAELAALREWGAIPPSDRYAMLSTIRQPALIVQGNKDVVVMLINGFLMAEHLPNAQLIMYPDASHGAQSQHADIFLEHAELFLG